MHTIKKQYAEICRQMEEQYRPSLEALGWTHIAFLWPARSTHSLHGAACWTGEIPLDSAVALVSPYEPWGELQDVHRQHPPDSFHRVPPKIILRPYPDVKTPSPYTIDMEFTDSVRWFDPDRRYAWRGQSHPLSAILPFFMTLEGRLVSQLESWYWQQCDDLQKQLWEAAGCTSS
jgi:hypothetical protein